MRSLFLALSLMGCAGAQQGATQLKPLEERRARAIIEAAIVDSGAQPARPRVVTVSTGATLTLDMAIEGGPYGVAYVTRDEQASLAGQLPARNPESDQLRVMRGANAIVLVVWEVDYRFDASAEHSATAVTAERKLKRDVSDFVNQFVNGGKGL